VATAAEMSHGGTRTPRAPAPVSGPGSLSKRTDGAPSQKDYQLPNAGYGEQAQYQQLQAGAPLAATPGPGAAVRPRPSGGNRPAMPVPFDAPTQRPDEPVTAGAALGPGPGPAALGGGPQQSYTSAIQSLIPLAGGSGGDEAAALLVRLGSQN
jgi:hypothetical protein